MSATSGSGTLVPCVPPELVDHIIDHLYDDKITLSTLSTVCRSFLPTASLHLFHYLSIDIARKSIYEFADFLRDAPPRIARNIRKLDIVSSPHYVGFSGWTIEKRTLPMAALASLLAHIPYLSELRLTSVKMMSTLPFPDSIPRPLERLSISWVWCVPLDACILLAFFSDIRSLHIEGATWFHIRPNPEDAVREINMIQPIPSTKVTNLDLSVSQHTRSFLEMLRRTKTAGSLERVNVICSNMLEVWSLGDFLGHAGQNVKHLVFDIARLYEGEVPEIPDHVRKCLALGPSCPSLETLTLKLKLDLLNDGVTSAMLGTVACLLQHAPPSLRNVVIELKLPLTVPRRTCEEHEIIRFADKEMSLEWSYLTLIAESFSSHSLQLVWVTGPVHSPDIAEVLTSIVRKKIPDCKICFASSAITVF